MVCNKPIVAYHLGYDNTGKPVISYSQKDKANGFPILRDCGSCLGCRLKKSKEWAVRCYKELEYWQDACFVTLTYNDNCLPLATSYSHLALEPPVVQPTLLRSDVVAFNKRLRTKLGRLGLTDKIKIFYAGEYGDNNHRPHYHLLIFGFKPFDLVPYRQNRFGQQLYNSSFLESLWYRKSPEFDKTKRRKWKKVSCGFVVVGDVSFTSASYVARYILKKQSTLHNSSEAFCKEFLGVSNGIGERWFKDNYQTVLANGCINYVKDNKILHCSIPRYFTEKLQEIDEVLYLEQKLKSYQILERKIDTFTDDFKKLENKRSNEKVLEFKTNVKFKRSFENEKSI